MDLRRHAEEPPRWAQSGVPLLGLALIWHSLGNHALFPPDEGRYAAVSGWMADHGNWLQPMLRDQLHITKPPLTYWAQAMAQRWLGHTELAVRLPSAVASSLLLAAVHHFARRTAGAMVAMMAVGVLAVMPIFAVVSRLAVTDPMLALWWWCAICCAWMALGEGVDGRARWIAGFWASCALIGLTKGPLILAPMVIVLAWLVLAGRARDFLRLKPWLGLPLAVAPLAAVAWGYWVANPERAAGVWRFEFVDRFTGGKHDDPAWTVPLAFVAGLFPATAMLTLPWFNMSWRSAWGVLRSGDLRALLIISAALPLVGFTLLKGSSPAYVLPMAAPIALLAGFTLARWVSRGAGDVPAGHRLPDVRITVGIVMTVIGVGLPAAAAVIVVRGHSPAWMPGWTLLWTSLGVVPAMVAAWMAMAWWGRPSLRLPALGACFAGAACLWLAERRCEDIAMEAMGPPIAARAITAFDGPVALIGINNPALDWYVGRWLPVFERYGQLREWMDANPGGRVLISESLLQELQGSKHALSRRIVPEERIDSWPMRKVVLCSFRPG